jgi:hypothetical protein
VSSAFAGEVVSDCVATGKPPGCHYSDGYLMQFEVRKDSVVKVYGPDGHAGVTLTVQLAKAGVYDVVVDSDGSFVVAAGSAGSGGVVLFDVSGAQTAVIDTGTYTPWHVSIAPDHSIWVMGHECCIPKDFNRVRRYSRSGDLLGSFLPQAKLGDNHAAEFFEPVGITASGDKIAIAAAGAGAGEPLAFIVLDAQGNTLSQVQGPAKVLTGWGFTSDGTVYAGFRDKLWRLDAAQGASREATTPAPGYFLIGANGKDLVFRSTTKEGHVKVATFAQPAERD